jgi:hypothetical protein
MGKAVTKKGAHELFPPSHASTYGLKIMARTRDTSQVISVQCQFCIYSGIELNPNRKRAAKTTPMAWTGPFRTDKFVDHHERQHPLEWVRYKASSFDAKTRFFDGVTPHANTMLVHINSGYTATPLKLKINSPIVDVFIGDMFFHPDQQGGTTQSTALKPFNRVPGVDDYYEVVIANPTQFRLVVSWVAGGASFRQCAGFLADTRRILGTTFLKCW